MNEPSGFLSVDGQVSPRKGYLTQPPPESHRGSAVSHFDPPATHLMSRRSLGASTSRTLPDSIVVELGP